MVVMMRVCKRVLFDEKCGRGHAVLISINNKSEFAGIEKKDGRIDNYTRIS